jgi:hypothetical protein
VLSKEEMAPSRRLPSMAKAVVCGVIGVWGSLFAAEARADIEGPISGTPVMLGSTFFSLAKVGYEESEYFVSGTANSYTSAEPLTSDGKWTVQVADQAAFKTRILVYRPIDSSKFNGTVIVEWLNVSGGTEAASEWIMAHNELIRKGYVWVGVSAQKAGIDGGGIDLTGLSLPLKKIAPKRYATLVHPGDQYSYDMYTQAAEAVVHPGSINPLGDLHVKRALAVGESQSADFMMAYVNAIAPNEQLFDGYFIHSRVHGSAGLMPQWSGSTVDFSSRSPVQVRDDLDVPVMMVQTETDLFILDSYTDLQPDSKNFRLWEIAGTSHADRYVSSIGLFDRSDYVSAAAVKEDYYAVPVLAKCSTPINSGPQHYVVSAALAALDRWVRFGIPPRQVDRLEVDAQGSSIVRDSFGIAKGGVRTPYVDVPIATLSGEGQAAGNLFCSLFGSTQLFDASELSGLYSSHKDYLSKFDASVRTAVGNGFLLQPDAERIKAWARRSNIGR